MQRNVCYHVVLTGLLIWACGVQPTVASWVGIDGSDTGTLLTTADLSFDDYVLGTSNSGDTSAVLYQTNDDAINLLDLSSGSSSNHVITSDAGAQISKQGLAVSDDLILAVYDLANNSDGISSAALIGGDLYTDLLFNDVNVYEATDLLDTAMSFGQASVLWVGEPSTGDSDLIFSTYDADEQMWSNVELASPFVANTEMQTYGDVRGFFYAKENGTWHFYYRNESSSEWTDVIVLDADTDLGENIVFPTLSVETSIQTNSNIVMYFTTGRESTEDPGNADSTNVFALTANKSNLSNWTLTKLSDSAETGDANNIYTEAQSGKVLIAWEGETESGVSIYTSVFSSGSWFTSEVGAFDEDNSTGGVELELIDAVLNYQGKATVLYRTGTNVNIDARTNEKLLKNVSTYLAQRKGGVWNVSEVYTEQYQDANPLSIYQNRRYTDILFSDQTNRVFLRYQRNGNAGGNPWHTRYYTRVSDLNLILGYDQVNTYDGRTLFHDYGVALWADESVASRTVKQEGSRTSDTWCDGSEFALQDLYRVNNKVKFLGICTDGTGTDYADSSSDGAGVMTLANQGTEWNADQPIPDYASYEGDDIVWMDNELDTAGRYYTAILYADDAVDDGDDAGDTGTYSLVFMMQR